MQKITNKVKTMPWPSLPEIMSPKQKWMVYTNLPVVNGEQILVITFISNPAQEKSFDWRSGGYVTTDTFRLVISKKKNDYRIIYPDGKVITGSESIWKGGSPSCTYCLIEVEDERRISNFTGFKNTQNHYIDAAWSFACVLREKRRRMASIARGEIQDEEVMDCPTELPEDFLHWIRREILDKDDTIIYKKGNVRGTCFLCGRRVRASVRGKFYNYQKTSCPDCGREVFAYLEDGQSWYAGNVDNATLFQKAKSGTLFVRQFRVLRDISVEYDPITNYLMEYARLAIRGNKTKKWSRIERYRTSPLQNSRERWDDDWKRDTEGSTYYYHTKVYTGNLEEAIRDTSIQYSCIGEWINREERGCVKYAAYAAQYPIIEFLAKGGYTRLLKDRIGGIDKGCEHAIRWTKTTLRECFRFPVRWLKVMPADEWTMSAIKRCNGLYEKRPDAPREEIEAVAKYNMEPLEPYLQYVTYVKTARYLERQKEAERKTGGNRLDYNALSTYVDYLKECTELRLDMTDKQVVYPPRLMEAHERASAQIEYQHNQEEQKKFQKQVEKLEKWSWQQGAMLIRPAKSGEELKAEGAALHHCVGGYANRMAEGQTAIFFVRKTEDPATPYYTLELQNKRLIQCRTIRNKSYGAPGEEAVKAFVDAWLAEVVNKPAKKKTKSQAVTAVA